MRRQLSDDKTKRTVTPGSIVYWKQGVSIVRRNVLEGEKRALSATRYFGTLYYEDRRPLYCATESHRTVSSGLFLGSQEARSEMEHAAGGSYVKRGDSRASSVLPHYCS